MRFHFNGEEYSFSFRYKKTVTEKRIDAGRNPIYCGTGPGGFVWVPSPGDQITLLRTITEWETSCLLYIKTQQGWEPIAAQSVRCSPQDQFSRNSGREKALSKYKHDNPFSASELTTASGIPEEELFYRTMRQAWHDRATVQERKGAGGA